MEANWSRPVPALSQNLAYLSVHLFDVIHFKEPENDNVEMVLSTLDRYGFHDLSEEEKLYLLYYQQWEFDGENHSLWEIIISRDKINIMIALLPLTPLFTVANESIPRDYTWIESSTWTQTTLLEHKLRWKPGGCKCKSHSNPVNEAEKLCAVTEIAFSMFAAQLFAESGIWNGYGMRCVLYLLNVAPNFIRIPVGLLHFKMETPLIFAIEYCDFDSDFIAVLLETGIPSGLAGKVVESILNKFVNTDSHSTRVASRFDFFTEMLVRRYKDEVLHYRDEDGYSLLHLVCRNCYWGARVDYANGTLFYYLKQLLDIGFDPRETNSNNNTALDELIHIFCNAENWTHAQEAADIDRTQYIALSFQECLDSLLPYFRGTPIAKIQLPERRTSRCETLEELNVYLIDVYRPLLDKYIFPENAEQYFYEMVVQSDFLCCEKSFPCLLCLRLVKLLYEELGKGFNLKEAVGIFYVDPESPLPQRIVQILYSFQHDNWNPCMCHISTPTARAKRPVSCKCCAWALLELMVHCAANLDSVHVSEDRISLMNLIQYDHTSDQNIAPVAEVDMPIVSMVTKFIWMYDPARKDIIMDYLHNLYGDAGETDRKTVSDLQDMMQSVRPLTLLCRLRILQYVKWKDLRLLHVPVIIRHYLELGDISNGHVVYRVL